MYVQNNSNQTVICISQQMRSYVVRFVFCFILVHFKQRLRPS